MTGTDEGIWRRLQLVPFDVVIAPDERDEHLGDQLALEVDHVLAWLVAGHQEWRQRGLAEPDAVRVATAEYRAESDVLGRFLEECCLVGPHRYVTSADLFATWRAWSTSEGNEPGTAKAFATALQNRGFDNHKDGSGRMRWTGLALLAEEDQ